MTESSSVPPLRGNAAWRGLEPVRRCASVAALCLVLAGCAVVGANHPHNKPAAAEAPAVPPAFVAALPGPRASEAAPADAAVEPAPEVAVALSFSGGGLRAAAFSLGAMQGLAAQPGPHDGNLLQQVGFITSVSGGALTAAWVGLNGTDSLVEFRRQALLHAGGHQMGSGVDNSVSLLRLANDGLPRWLDSEVFHGATFAGMNAPGRPVVWINASNLKQRLPFVFHQRTFEALCSDIATYPVAEAVAASMAVPLVFAPVVLEKHPEHCGTELPAWVDGDGLALDRKSVV